MFAQFKVIPKTRNTFVEIVAVAERYLIIIHVKTKESKKQPFRICLSLIIYLRWWKNISKKISLYLLSIWARWLEKQTLFHEDELAVKYLENLAIANICGCFEWCEIQHYLIFRLWVIMFTQERALQQRFIYSKSRIETVKIECEICSKLTIKTSGRLSTLFIVNFEHFHSFFLCSAVDFGSHPINL